MTIKSLAKNYFAKNSTVGLWSTSKMASDGCSAFNHIILKIVFIENYNFLQISDEISV